MKIARLSLSTALMVFALVVAGCATETVIEDTAHRDYVAQNGPLAVSGSMKWSEYYTGLRVAAVKSGAPAPALNRMDSLIASARQYESGTITQDVFEQRRVETLATASAEHAAAEKERLRKPSGPSAFMAPIPIRSAYRLEQPGYARGPSPVPKRRFMTAELEAKFTGKQEKVLAASSQPGLKCEYRTTATTFTKVFASACPVTVQLE